MGDFKGKENGAWLSSSSGERGEYKIQQEASNSGQWRAEFCTNGKHNQFWAGGEVRDTSDKGGKMVTVFSSKCACSNPMGARRIQLGVTKEGGKRRDRIIHGGGGKGKMGLGTNQRLSKRKPRT